MRIATPPASCKVYTPGDLAEAMVRALGDFPGATWLEPSHGNGAFVQANTSLPLYAAIQVTAAGPALARLRELGGAARILLDGPSGGSGKPFPWALAEEARSLHRAPIFVAGGLTPDNVAQAIREARPNGVDVASGIEGPDGLKDAARVRAFVAAARKAS